MSTDNDHAAAAAHPFKVGDRVQLVLPLRAAYFSFVRYGETGTVTSADHTSVVVQLDEPYRDGHLRTRQFVVGGRDYDGIDMIKRIVDRAPAEKTMPVPNATAGDAFASLSEALREVDRLRSHVVDLQQTLRKAHVLVAEALNMSDGTSTRNTTL